MPIQYSKDKTRRLSFRVNDRLADWVDERSKVLGVSPCEYARSVLFTQMSIEASLSAIDNATKPAVAVNARGKKCAHPKQ